jgi:site-specific recombinase XerD
MLNAGMPVTSLQRYLDHENLDTTMGYAGVSDPLL